MARDPRGDRGVTGKNHDRFSIAIAPIFAIAFFYSLPSLPFLAAAFGYMAGWLYLSPDLDLPQSRPSKRWGLFRLFWVPYQKSRKHRGRSHWPIYGSAERIACLCLLLSPSALLLCLHAGIGWADALNVVGEHRRAIAAAYIGVESACLLHLTCDYTPGLRRL